MKSRGCSVWTAPLTAGGATVLEALTVLKALAWEKMPADDPRTAQARLEALRLAWDDRLRFLGGLVHITRAHVDGFAGLHEFAAQMTRTRHNRARLGVAG